TPRASRSARPRQRRRLRPVPPLQQGPRRLLRAVHGRGEDRDAVGECHGLREERQLKDIGGTRSSASSKSLRGGNAREDWDARERVPPSQYFGTLVSICSAQAVIPPSRLLSL